ncbi:MAG: DUF4296 domain-containing protein [Bacteroidetes bacterium]|nr:DUF4296 domain-containing protein [Bacteroidota bacterium]
MNKRNHCNSPIITLRISVLLGFLFVMGCSNSSKNKPQNIIESGTFSHIIAELKIIDAAYQLGVAPREASESQKTVVLDTADSPSKSIVGITNKIKEKLGENKVSEYKPTVISKREYKGNVGADYDFIFNKYHVTRPQFEESLDYYSQNPDLFQPILEKTLEILTHEDIQVSKK